MVNYPCPVCGYLLQQPAADFRICPSCGTEFGYDDAGTTHAELRAIWLRSGAHWWSPEPLPLNWDPYLQLDNIVSEAPVWRRVFNLGTAPQQQPSASFIAMIAGQDGQRNPGSGLYGQAKPQGLTA